MNLIKYIFLTVTFFSITKCTDINERFEPAPISDFFSDAVEYPNFNPDGTKILYTDDGYSATRDLRIGVQNHDSIGIWVINSDGTGSKKIYDFTSIDYFGKTDWSPSGEQILLMYNANIYIASYDGSTVDTSSIEQLTFEGVNLLPQWSPDGKYIIYNQTYCYIDGVSCGLWLLSLEDKTSKFIHFAIESATWSFDSKRIMFVENSFSNSSTKFYEYDLNNDSIQLKYEMIGESRNLNLSPTNDVLVFEYGLIGEAKNIWKFDFEFENLTQLTFKYGLMPNWNKDGTKITYVAGGIWTMNSDGSNKENIKPVRYLD